MIRLVLAGSFTVDAADLKKLLSVAPDIETVEVVGSVDHLCLLAKAGRPMTTLLYAELSEPDIAAAARALAGLDERNTLIVVVESATVAKVRSVLQAGARGIVLPDSPVEELLTAVRAVAAGHPFVPAPFLTSLGERLFTVTAQAGRRRGGHRLTPRELEVLRVMAVGLPNSEIAKKLFISEATARSHVLSILRKLRARNRTEAVANAYRDGLLATEYLLPTATE
ncbi:LuxR C-terminal-related transcriptional regulator [Amycolatopsis vastitatis]|uniref:HTH luxR-type domain-containing protein n=1 Tax=Amycolatopsis vastitatis TaxID=1905142 RepID=A0A229TAZ8_9PSEU|nr:response regulator transcription factor [Amycolatopsis vastitatis]OXM68435.1 hypothetical protein CF165_13055 [Amycolatopsis vastitatis]